MKCLLVSTFEQQGGAARSAHRLHCDLCQRGIDSRMLVQYRKSEDERVLGPRSGVARLSALFRPYIDGLPLLCYRSRLSPPWSLAWFPNNIHRDIKAFKPDVVHIHNVGHGFLPLAAIKRLRWPIVWTMHDSWVFTGGCHLPGSCELYKVDCGSCPQLNARHEHDLSRWGWHRKSECWSRLDITFVAPSNWLAQKAKSSALLGSMSIEVIPNGIDTTRFMPMDQNAARTALELPLGSRILLFGASRFTRDSNKGFSLLCEALAVLSEGGVRQNITLALFGDDNFCESTLHGITIRSFGSIISDERLRMLYCASDLFILPSLQENLPNTVLEAMACGIPCVAFAVGGVDDLIVHAENGYLVRPVDVRALAAGIHRLLNDEERRSIYGQLARRKIEKGFSLQVVTEKYLNLYDRVTSSAQRYPER